MKRKTNRIPVIVFMMALMAFALLPVASYAGALAGEPYDCDTLNPNSAQVKPTIALSAVTLTAVPDDRSVNVELSVACAAGRYCSTGLYVKFDSKLTLIEATKGQAGSNLSGQYRMGNDGIYLMTSGSGNNGQDGVLWNLKFQLPEDWALHDKYFVELWNYRGAVGSSEFTNVANDEEGQLMQAYAFTQGIMQGYILINTGQPRATLKKKPTAADLTYNAEKQELVKGDGEAEGGTLQYAISASSTTAPASGWSDHIPAMKDAEKYNVWVKVKGDSSHVDSDPACVPAEIKKAPLTITAKDQTLVYNGETQGEGDTAYDDTAQIAERVTTEGLQGGDQLTSIIIFSQGKDIGTYPITLYNAAIGKDGMNTDNYAIKLVKGTLTISPIPLKVTIKGSSAKKTYNGKQQTYQGKVTVTSQDKAFDASKFRYTGSTVVKGTKAGSYTTKLTAAGCVYSDSNYALNVTIGSPIKLTITGGSVVNKAAAKIALDEGVVAKSFGNKVTASWGAVKGASSYVIYANYCDQKKCKKIKTVSGKTTSFDITKLNGKKFNPKKNLKFYVVAYQKVNGKNVKLSESIMAHAPGSKNSKRTNVTGVKVKKASFTLKKNKTAKIKAKLVLQKKGKKPLKHEAKFRYATSNAEVAKVSKKGKITAVGKGTCTVYVYAVSGVSKKIKVTVK